ncbi:MAG: trypsin-like peptidase domain-containing protein [Pirellulales bacterium]
MEIVCRCTKCSAPFKVDSQFVGRKAKCPQCAHVNVVAAPEDVASPPVLVPPPRFTDSPPTDDQMTSADIPGPHTLPSGGVVINPNPTAQPTTAGRRSPPPAGGSPGSSRFTGAPATRPASPPPAPVPPPVEMPVEEEFPIKVADRPTSGKRSGKGARGRSSGGKKIPPMAWVVGAGVGALLLAVAAITTIVFVMSGRDPSFTRVGAKPSLVVELPVEGRRDMKLFLNDKTHPIPDTGPAQLIVEEGTHKLTLQRRGYHQVDHSFTVRKGDSLPFTPAWEPTMSPPIAGGTPGTNPAGGSPPAAPSDFQAGPTGFAGWQQLLEVAQKMALAQKRDIFLVFSGSDWSKQTRTMTDEIFSQPKFRAFAEQRFVLLVVDLPRTEQGINQLADISQNRNLSMQFGIRSVPTVLLLDAGGTPYAADGFFGDGLDKYIQHITLLQNKHAQRDVRLAAVDASRNKSPAERLAALEAAVRWLQDEKLTPHYGRILDKWMAQARQLDPTNELGKQEIVFEADWVARLNSSLVDREKAKAAAVVADLMNWSKSHKFLDANRAVRVHLIAALLLLNAMDDPENAQRHIELAGTYQPSDEKLKQELAGMANWARRKDQLSSGTGFIVGADGYVLTNYHVIEGPGETVVRVPTQGGMESVRADVIATDVQQDIALLKVDAARFPSFKPLAVSADRVRRGAEVAVFGFPLGDDLGKDVRITTGVIHSPSEQSEDKRHVLDCRINPGNSGGPVMNRAGRVIGMVTAKTAGGVGLDSYGVAIAAPDLQTFLSKNLPGYQIPSPGEAGATADSPLRLEWEAVDEQASASVLMVLKIRTP